MHLVELQTLMDDLYGARDRERGLASSVAWLTEEVGEVARIIARTYGEQSSKDSDKKVILADELADVLFVLICIANQTGVNLTDALEKNLEKKTSRDSTRHRSNKKLR